MNDTNTLDAPAIIANVEAYLAHQYEQRVSVVQTHPYDGVVIIAAWVLIGWIVIGGK